MAENVRVAGKRAVAEDVVEVVLTEAAGRELPAWEPGAHVVLDLPNGLRRQYSLCGPDQLSGSWTIAVHRSPTSRGGSAFVHDELAVGDVLAVTGPTNNFPFEPAERILFIAGGIGVTPILPMVRQARLDRAVDLRFLYCGRSRPLMAYCEEIGSWHDDRMLVRPDDEYAGRPDLAEWLALDAGATVYCCGPESMIEAVESLAGDRSLVRVERFRATDADTSKDTGFDVIVSGSGQRFRVAAGHSILETLERAGYDLPFSCREGICGTCETVVVKGIPDHRDSVLTDTERAENTVMMVCCSRAQGDELVLELAEW
jgi:ferredoxin-NADP reductase